MRTFTSFVIAILCVFLLKTSVATLHADDAYALSQICTYDQATRQPPPTQPLDCTVEYITANACYGIFSWAECDSSVPYQRITSLYNSILHSSLSLHHLPQFP